MIILFNPTTPSYALSHVQRGSAGQATERLNPTYCRSYETKGGGGTTCFLLDFGFDDLSPLKISTKTTSDTSGTSSLVAYV